VGDPGRALAALNAAVTSREPLKTLPWPATLDDAGEQGRNHSNGDIVLMRLETSQVIRVTNTPALETSPNSHPTAKS